MFNTARVIQARGAEKGHCLEWGCGWSGGRGMGGVVGMWVVVPHRSHCTMGDITYHPENDCSRAFYTFKLSLVCRQARCLVSPAVELSKKVSLLGKLIHKQMLENREVVHSRELCGTCDRPAITGREIEERKWVKSNSG